MKGTPGQHPRSFRRQITKAVKLDYLLFLPRDYGRDLEKKWPLMLFLHGAGEPLLHLVDWGRGLLGRIKCIKGGYATVSSSAT